MSLVDSPNPDYLQQGGPSEKKAPWLRRHFWQLTLVVLNLSLASLILTTFVTRPDLFQPTGGLRGRVVDAAGNPPPNALVFVSSAERWVIVDGDGHFSMERVPVGEALVLVMKAPQGNSAGGAPLSQAVTIAARQTLDLGTLTFADEP